MRMYFNWNQSAFLWNEAKFQSHPTEKINKKIYWQLRSSSLRVIFQHFISCWEFKLFCNFHRKKNTQKKWIENFFLHHLWNTCPNDIAELLATSDEPKLKREKKWMNECEWVTFVAEFFSSLLNFQMARTKGHTKYGIANDWWHLNRNSEQVFTPMEHISLMPYA